MRLTHGLSPSVLERIRGVLTDFPEVNQAFLFGSRAKQSHKLGSDIDLALVGEALDWRVVGRLYDALDDLLLPYGFSLVVYDKQTDPDVAGHIRRVGVPIFARSETFGDAALT